MDTTGNIISSNLGLLCGGFFVLIFLVLGLVLLIGNIRARKRADASQSWPSTTGSVLKAEVKTSVKHDEDGYVESTTYYRHVEYSYAVGGVPYQSKKLSFGSNQMFSTHQQAENALIPYPVGGQVTVFYNPEKFDDAVLERVAPKSKIGMIIGIIFIVISACVGLIGLISLIMKLV